jgi:hypothetical protein
MASAARWRVDFAAAAPSSAGVPEPPGYDASAVAAREAEDATGAGAVKRRGADAAFKQGKAWELARSPATQLPMMMFMMWMSGNGVQVFSIMITFTSILNPVKAIMASGATFARFADTGVDTQLPRLAFVALNCVGLLFALNKLDKMGLLPTHASDWQPSAAPLHALETASAGLPLVW